MPVAADALEKKLAKVIPTCTLEKNLVCYCKSLSISMAFLFPSSAKTFILFLFKDTIAISLAEKKAFIKVNINIKIN